MSLTGLGARRRPSTRGRGVLAALVLGLLAGDLAAAQDPEDDASLGELHAALDAWLDRRWDATEEQTAALLARCEAAEATVVEVEALLRRGRHQLPALPYEIGAVQRVPLRCDHVDYETAFFLYLPRDYDPEEVLPLVLVGHGGNSEMSQQRAETTAQAYLRAWVPAADQAGLILAAPATARGWGRIGNSVLFSTISRLGRELRVDADRVHCTGQSMGGHLTWRSGISFADRWGSISPQSGGYDYVANEQIFRLFNVPGYVTFGEREPYQIADFNRKMRAWMAERHYPWIFVEKLGRGHEIFGDELPKIAEFFHAHPRDLYRDRVWIEAGTLELAEAEPRRPRWPQEHHWDPRRPIVYSTCHWVEVGPLDEEHPEHGKHQRAFVEKLGPDRLRIRTRNVDRLELALHPRMFDLDQPLTVELNGQERVVPIPPPSLRELLERVRRFDDRGRIFHSTLSLEVEGETPELVPPRPAADRDSRER